MPIKIKTDLEFGDIFYIKADPDQLEHFLIEVIIVPGSIEPKGALKFKLSHQGETCIVWDFECSKVRDKNKLLDIIPEE
jgi:hypothetical protein